MEYNNSFRIRFHMAQPNLHFQSKWVQHKSILKYAIYTTNRRMVQEWSADVLTELRHWKDNQPKIIFDLSYPNASMSYFVLSKRELFNMGITTEGKNHFLEFLEKNPQLNIKLAVILSSTMLGVLNNYVPNTYGYDNFQAKIFFNATTAQQWLMVDTDEHSTNAVTSEMLLKVIQTLEADKSDEYGNREHLHILVNGTLEIIPISETRPVIVGRSSRADLDLGAFGEAARGVSRQHAQISLSNGRLTILDLNSRNGIFVSNQKVDAGKAVFLSRDNVIRLGGIKFSIIF